MFLINCKNCGWKLKTRGISSELSHLKEIKTCEKCGKPRVFHCPVCKSHAKMFKVKI